MKQPNEIALCFTTLHTFCKVKKLQKELMTSSRYKSNFIPMKSRLSILGGKEWFCPSMSSSGIDSKDLLWMAVLVHSKCVLFRWMIRVLSESFEQCSGRYSEAEYVCFLEYCYERTWFLLFYSITCNMSSVLTSACRTGNLERSAETSNTNIYEYKKWAEKRGRRKHGWAVRTQHAGSVFAHSLTMERISSSSRMKRKIIHTSTYLKQLNWETDAVSVRDCLVLVARVGVLA